MRYVLLTILLAGALNCSAQKQGDQDPIDKAYENCKLEHSDAAGIANCAFEAYKHWDSELNKYYNRILKSLKKQGDIGSFKNAQKAWVAFRDAEFTAYNGMFNRPGDQWATIRAENRIAIVRARALQLRNYSDSLQRKR